VLKEESRRGGDLIEEVNAKDFVDDIWIVRDEHRLLLRMLVRGKPSPYNIYQALTGKASAIEAQKYPATRVEAFTEIDRTQQDFLRPNCIECGYPIPINLIDKPYDPSYCPVCKDTHDGIRVDILQPA
jgi:predicted Zn-ribbon and HTH transcriptional regulator